MLGIKTKINNIKYKNQNKHNYTYLVRQVDPKLIKVGKQTYGGLNVITYSGKNGNLKIGNYCSIADDVTFILGGEHNYKKFSTFPFKKMGFGIPESETKGDIIIEDDVWIGYGAFIMAGVKIGQGSIIGAKSVVTKDIPPYAIYVGNKIIKYRFSESVIQKLLEIDYSKLDIDFVKNNYDKLNIDINEDNYESLVDFIKMGEKK